MDNIDIIFLLIINPLSLIDRTQTPRYSGDVDYVSMLKALIIK